MSPSLVVNVVLGMEPCLPISKLGELRGALLASGGVAKRPSQSKGNREWTGMGLGAAAWPVWPRTEFGIKPEQCRI